jgi:hypothetical protein
MKGTSRYLSRLVLAALLLGASSLSPTQQMQMCTEDSFTPNYIPQLSALLRWHSFPLRVYFMRDAHYTAKRQQLAMASFSQWVNLTNKRIQFTVVDSEQQAQLLVRFDPSTRAGRTEYTYYPERREIVRAEMVIGVQGDAANDIQSVAVHEFGHALGIAGHSDEPRDVMYPRYKVGRLATVSPRDLNTVKTAYCELFEGGTPLPSSDRTRGLPSSRDVQKKGRIVCEEPGSAN